MRLSDPVEGAELHKRLAYLARNNAPSPNGMCPVCKKPLDDHKWTSKGLVVCKAKSKQREAVEETDD